MPCHHCTSSSVYRHKCPHALQQASFYEIINEITLYVIFKSNKK